MTVQFPINIEELLTPITTEQPVGENLRLDESADALYYQLKDLRNQARYLEHKQMQEAEQQFINTSDWQKFAKLAVKVLQQDTKDFEIGCWLTEAWVRSDGFTGLYNGLLLLQGLLTQFWPTLYPAEDEEGPAAKLIAFLGLNGGETPGSLIVPIMAQPVTNGGSQARFAAWQYAQALEVAQIREPGKRLARIQQGAADLNQIKHAASQTSTAFMQDSLEQIDACLSALAQLENTFITLCGTEEAPLAHHIRRALQDCANAIKTLQKELPVPIIKPEETAILDNEQPVETVISNSASNHPKTRAPSKQAVTGSRQEALQHLLDIAQFFRATEPHSPVSYLLEKAIHWGQLTLPELLDELVMDRNVRFDIGRMTGAQSAQFQQAPAYEEQTSSYQEEQQADEEYDNEYLDDNN